MPAATPSSGPRGAGDHLMADLCASNDKLRARSRRITALATGAEPAAVDAALAATGGRLRAALRAALDRPH
ncbi:hypothetical protein K353_00595 [Kitasatospora sp. SolWspMP-SS2h]|nr:hypothetical protein K353_00595 [Kitasatospora sp. SolWspMP-SS2h]